MKVEIKICPVKDRDVWHCDLVITHEKSVLRSRRSYDYSLTPYPFTELGALSEAFTQFSEDLKHWSISKEEDDS